MYSTNAVTSASIVAMVSPTAPPKPSIGVLVSEPVAVSFHAVAAALPPLSFMTVFFSVKCGAGRDSIDPASILTCALQLPPVTDSHITWYGTPRTPEAVFIQSFGLARCAPNAAITCELSVLKSTKS